jgi:ABC-2 type transport system permease protein
MSPPDSDLDRRTYGFMAAWRRFVAIFVKEFIQLRRDRLTFATMIMIPVLQLLLFGYAINTDPKHLPAAVLMRDDSPISRSLLSAIRATNYFNVMGVVHSVEEADRLLLSNQAQFIVEIPENFGRNVVRGQRPALLVTADATDPTATGGAINALSGIGADRADLARRSSARSPVSRRSAAPFRARAPTATTRAARPSTNIVPGLLAIILSMTMVMITAVAIVKESERGTMEMLIATPVPRSR